VGTIFHNTKLDLQKWFLAVSLILDAKKGLSSRQLARHLQVTPNTAWYVGMRIRKAMLDNGGLLQGIIEMDECFIGGKPRKGNRPFGGGIRGRGTKKVPVVGLVERGGNVKAKVSPVMTSKRLRQLVKRNVNAENSRLMTDEYKGYIRMREILPHSTINHQIQYVNGEIHTNTIEGFWSLLKRGIIGQYHKVSMPYLQQYINEFAYRYNNRKNERIFDETILRAVGGTA
jgi:transposase-like protein